MKTKYLQYLFAIAIIVQVCKCKEIPNEDSFDEKLSYQLIMKLKDKFYIDNYVFLDICDYDTINRNRPVCKFEDYKTPDSKKFKTKIANYCVFNNKKIDLKSDAKAISSIGELFTVDSISFIIVWNICGPLYIEFYDNNGNKKKEITDGVHAHSSGLLSKDKRILFVTDLESISGSPASPTTVKIYDTQKMVMLKEIGKLKVKFQFYFMGIDKDENFLYLIERDGKYIKIDLKKIRKEILAK